MREFKFGDIVQHFKRETIEGDKGSKYLYMIIGISKHTETGELMMNYKPLYEDSYFDGINFISRPLNMFMSEVNHEQYPNIKQQYRFEKVTLRSAKD